MLELTAKMSSPLLPDMPAIVTEPAASPGIIRLKPLLARGLPKIDEGSALIADENLAVPREIVAGVLHAGTKGVLASSSKAGKTWVMLDLATSITTGTRFLKWSTTGGKVLFVNFEIHRAFIKGRLQIIKERKELPNLDNLRVWTLRGASAEPDDVIQAIVDEIRTDRYALIILDPIYKLMLGRSENMASGVGALVQNIDQLMEKTGAAVVYAHHFTKGNQAKKTAMDRISGSGVFARDADTIITLTEHKEEGCYAVEMTLRNLPPQPAFVVEWDFPLMVERPDLDPDDLKREEGEDDDDLEPLLELLDPKPLTTGEWQEAAEGEGYSRPTFFRKRVRLEAAGRVEFDRHQRTWARASAVGVAEGGLASAGFGPSQRETSETSETSETFETPEANTGAQTAFVVRAGQKSAGCKSLDTPGSSGGELLADEGGKSSGEGPKEHTAEVGGSCLVHAAIESTSLTSRATPT